jgi:RimJ/RimL family protein N-acetyltransferase
MSPQPAGGAGDPVVGGIATERLLLRRWRPEDRAPFAAMNADPEVMAYFPSTLDAEASDRIIERAEALFDRRGFGWWAVEVPGRAEFIGFVGLGLAVPLPGRPEESIEVGWRLDRPYWGRGYASEAARAAVSDGFDRLAVREIIAYTARDNRRSRRVMERIGMRRDPSDPRGTFDHPGLPVDHPLRPHVLYRASAGEWPRFGST